MTETEFKETFLTRKNSNTTSFTAWDGTCTACVRFPEQAALMADPPASFDWTTKGAVTPVKDQGQCGSCWSFGTTGDLEGTHFLAGNKLVALSEQELVSCDTKSQDKGCNGGLQEDAFEFVIKHGLTSEAHYPYTSGEGRSGTCQSAKESPVAATMKSWVQVSKRGASESEDAIMKALIASGPVTIGINASPMQRYVGGIQNPLFCSGLALDHAVLIVGYGTENGKDCMPPCGSNHGPADSPHPLLTRSRPILGQTGRSRTRGTRTGARTAIIASCAASTSAASPTTPSTRSSERRSDEEERDPPTGVSS